MEIKSMFTVGDKVRKVKGYAFDGTVIGVCQTLTGHIRIIVEFITANGEGMLHIFSENQLEKRHE